MGSPRLTLTWHASKYRVHTLHQRYISKLQGSGAAVWKWRWPSWAPVPNKPTVFVDVKQHFNNNINCAKGTSSGGVCVPCIYSHTRWELPKVTPVFPVVLHVFRALTERSFSYAGPSVWNNLPQTLRHSDSASSFKAALKTHLFNNYF